MPNIIINRESDGSLQAYIAKKDVELAVVSLEFQEETRWGGKIELDDGSEYYIEPLDTAPSLPKTVRARRAAA